MMCYEWILLSEIGMKDIKRKDIAVTYRLAIESNEKLNWEKINKAIINEWSFSGLKYIKHLAWSFSSIPNPKGGVR